MDLKITDEQVRDIVSEAIWSTLDERQRDTMIKGAITHLLTPKKDPGYWGTQETPLQAAFHTAIRQVAVDVAREMLAENPTVRAEITKLITQGMERAMGERREQTVAMVAEGIANAFNCHK